MRLAHLCLAGALLALASCGAHDPQRVTPEGSAVEVYAADHVALTRMRSEVYDTGSSDFDTFHTSVIVEPATSTTPARIYLNARTDPAGIERDTELINSLLNGLDQLHLLDIRAFHTPPEGVTK